MSSKCVVHIHVHVDFVLPTPLSANNRTGWLACYQPSNTGIYFTQLLWHIIGKGGVLNLLYGRDLCFHRNMPGAEVESLYVLRLGMLNEGLRGPARVTDPARERPVLNKL